MLILANGAFKSGSTWLWAILDEMVHSETIPQEFKHPFYPRLIDQAKLKAFLKTVDCKSKNYLLLQRHFRFTSRFAMSRYLVRLTGKVASTVASEKVPLQTHVVVLSKSHIYSKRMRDLLLSYNDVYVFDIQRDMKDVLVSHYHHLLRHSKIHNDFDWYYWSIGRYKAYQVVLYHATWEVPSSRVYVSCFERLKTQFKDEISRMAEVLGIHLRTEEIRRIQQGTSLEILKKRHGEQGKGEDERFFRKGIIGDWVHYFDDSMMADLRSIEVGGLKALERAKYHLLFTARPAIKLYIRSKLPNVYSFLQKRL